MVFTFLEVIPVISSLISLFPIGYLVRRREVHKSYYSVTWKLSKYLKPSDLLAERPFEDYYESRDFDDQISEALGKHQNILIKGIPLAGKSRAIYEALKNNKESFDVLIPRCREINPDSFVIPYRARLWRKGVVIFDDLQRFVEQPGFGYLVSEISKRKYIIIASSRTGASFQLVECKFAGEGLALDSFFGRNVIEILLVDEDIAKKIAQNLRKDWEKISFNGTIGSIFMELFTMKTRFSNALNDEKTILRSIQKLYRCGVFLERGTFRQEWIRRISLCNDIIWTRSLETLQLNEFIKVKKEDISIEPVYIEEIITPFPEKGPRDLCDELANIFENDPYVLLRIGNRLQDLGRASKNVVDFIKDAIVIYRKVLDKNPASLSPYEYALAQNELGVAYGNLASIEERAKNSRLSVEAFKEVLKISIMEQFPIQYAATLNNLGCAYGSLAIEDETGENIKQAILAFNKSLMIRTIDLFPREYATTQHNLGCAYLTLSREQEKAENCRLAIAAFEVALTIRTIDQFPIEYAQTKHTLGCAYGMLTDEEEKAKNSLHAIEAFKESLKIRTIDQFPIEYAQTQNDLGQAYLCLASVVEKADNSRRAIAAYEESLKIFTVDKFPTFYARALEGLRIACVTLAEA
jgi:tetratricopeptide (TPR) repeat protein